MPSYGYLRNTKKLEYIYSYNFICICMSSLDWVDKQLHLTVLKLYQKVLEQVDFSKSFIQENFALIHKRLLVTGMGKKNTFVFEAK